MQKKHSFLYKKRNKNGLYKEDTMKKYTYISIIALLSGVFLMQPMESGKSSAESLARESKKDDTGSVVYGGSSSDSDDDGLDGALLQRKNLRYKIPLGIPSSSLS